MKKIAFLTLILGLGFAVCTSTASAYKYEGPSVINTKSRSYKKDTQTRYLDALRARYDLSATKASQTIEDKNVYNQQAVHRIRKYISNVNEVDTEVSRKGELQDRTGVVPVANIRFERPNAKQTFRARAIDYYVDGGEANEEAMAAGVIYGSTHKVNRNNWVSDMYKKQLGATILPVRDMIRVQEKQETVGNGQEGQISYKNRAGNFYRNFWSPAMSTKWLEE
ncbi:hypothetical protein HN954_02445 [bacterium]|jgi:hypothetical protein|nr:hypothetical protein [bacterium]MBT6831620.1 hypothetical protein [bacterium]MBT6996265.1 hypothetical protein [bacterium]MBT7772943.1 hypothetical protein [bacterium]